MYKRPAIEPRNTWGRIAREPTSMTSKVSLWAMASLGLGLAFTGTAGCKDQQKCDDALKTSRQAMQDEFLDMTLARQWREFAGKACGIGAELAALDKDIVDREVALAKAAEDKAKAEESAGKTAIESASRLWKDFDQLPEAERSEAALKKSKSKASKLLLGLAPAYAEQLLKYNDSAFKRRLERLPKPVDAK
jgi:hypothetical protein